MPMLIYPEECEHCGAAHPYPGGGWDNLGDHACPGCGRDDVFHVEWDTEVGLDPVEE